MTRLLRTEQLVQYHFVVLDGRGATEQGDVLVASVEEPETDDLANGVTVEQGRGVALPIRSELGPVLFRMSIGAPGPHPGMAGMTPAFAWESPKPIDFGSPWVTLMSAGLPMGELQQVELPRQVARVHVGWVFDDVPANEFDQVTESLFISLW